jgi:hypothetical protein
MRWRGQGLLTGVVLTAAATLGYQWTSMATLVERATHEEIEYSTYTRLVSQFVEENKRWPEPHDITLPKPPHKGVIKKATLKTNGEILFTLSGWSIQSGRVTVLLSPTLKTHSHLLPGSHNRLEYNCTIVNPSSMERTLCDRTGTTTTTTAEVSNKNANAFAEWEKNESDAKNEMTARTSNLSLASASDTQCDVHLRRVEQEIIPCLTQIDESAALQVKERFQTLFNRPRLRPEIIVDNPDLVAQFNSECDGSWNSTAAMVKMQNPKFDACFY